MARRSRTRPTKWRKRPSHHESILGPNWQVARCAIKDDQKGVTTMNVPVVVLLGFAMWTLLTLFGSVGVYRWSHILTGRTSISEWRAGAPQGSEWYQRAMRAHMNCVENLPIFAALVVALIATGLHSPSIDALSGTFLVARIGQTLVH